MPRSSIVPQLRERILPYLADLAAIYAETKKTTLPVTSDGKVNVSAVADALGLSSTQRQHLYKPELTELLNEAAEAQGVKGIGSRGGDDETAAAEIARAQRRASEAMTLLAEREGTIVALRLENQSLRARISLLTDTGMVMRTEAD